MALQLEGLADEAHGDGAGASATDKDGAIAEDAPRERLGDIDGLVTAGEFRSPFRFDSIDDMMWKYKYNTEDRTYLCENRRGI